MILCETLILASHFNQRGSSITMADFMLACTQQWMHQPLHDVHNPELLEAFRSLALGRTVYLTCLYGLCFPLRLMIPISLSPTHIKGTGKPLECARSAKLRLQSFRITSKK